MTYQLPEPDRTLCMVKGNIAPGAMCGSMIVGDKSCGNRTSPCQHKVPQYTASQMQAAYAAGVAAERAACAALVDAIEARCVAKDVDDPPLTHVSAAIRQRGEDMSDLSALRGIQGVGL